jgi:hypothetical protein
MFKEQFFCLAMKLYARAFDIKERIRNGLKNEALADYLQNVSIFVRDLRKNQKPAGSEQKRSKKSSHTAIPNFFDKKDKTSYINRRIEPKKIRKSSIKPAKEIGSLRADVILQKLKENNLRRVSIDDAIDGKKSLAYLIWALGHAQEAQIQQGISIHDVTALLYRACEIELYPINVSRVVYKNPALVRKAGQEKRTKTYLLTSEGQMLFKEKFL